MTLPIRPETPRDRPAVLRLYRHAGYGGTPADNDRVYVAEDAGRIVGVVRLAREHGTHVLRGMVVAAEHRRLGVGSRLLLALEKEIGPRVCFCLPYTHLEVFYGRVGFRPLTAADQAPRFLRQRLASYRRAEHDVIVMMRPGT